MRTSVVEVAIISKLDPCVAGKPVKEFKDVLTVDVYRYHNLAMPFAPNSYLDVTVSPVGGFHCGKNGIKIECQSPGSDRSRVTLYSHLHGDYAGALYDCLVVDLRDIVLGSYTEARRLVIQAADPSINDTVARELLCGPSNAVSIAALSQP